MNIDFVVPLVVTPEDNQTIINKGYIMLKDCSRLVPQDGCAGWNFNKCANDDTYKNPYVDGDTIPIQIAYDVVAYPGGITATVINIADDGEVDATILYQQGIDAFNNVYVNIIISEINLNKTNCFYIKLDYCETVDCGKIQTFYSEPYEVVSCDASTILIKGNYPKYDCDGGYYGLFGTKLNIYYSQIRVYGTIEKTDIDITEKATGNNIRTSSTKNDVYTVRTKKIPPYVVEKMAICFAAKDYYVDGLQYTGGVRMSKTFEEGKMWIVTCAINVLCLENNFTCT